MERYVLWSEVQERLIQYAKEFGHYTSFSNAVRLLVEEGALYTEEKLPDVDFALWDSGSIPAIHKMLDSIPVSVDRILKALPEESELETENILPVKIASHQQKELYRHGKFGFGYALAGKGIMRTETGQIPFETGTLCLTAPEIPFDMVAEPDSEIISVVLGRESLEAILQKLLRKENIMAEFFHSALSPERQGYVLLGLPPDENVCHLIKQIFLEGYSSEPYSDEVCEYYIGLLFSYALRASIALPDSGARSKNHATAITSVIRYIQTHYRTTSLTEVAQVFHYSPHYLGRQIKACLGRGYSELVQELKLGEAKRMLRETKLTAEQIAEQTGFGSAVHLSRTFRKKLGMSPREYRKQ